MPKVVVLVLRDLNRLEEVLASWHDSGVPAVTVLDGLGTREAEERARREDLPILPTIRDILQSDDAPRKVVFSVVSEGAVEKVVRATEDVLGDLALERSGFLFVLPLSLARGLPER